MKTTNKNIFEQSFDGQRLYRAKNDAYEFDIFSDTWQLGTKNFIYLDWMHNLNYDQQTFIDLPYCWQKLQPCKVLALH